MTKRSAPVFKLVADEKSADTVQLLKALLYEAEEEKRLVGIAFVGIYRGGDYIANTAGLARDHVTSTIGMLDVLRSMLTRKEASHSAV